MSQIRPFERSDLPAVARLLQAELLVRVRDVPRSIEGFLADTLLEGPWADPELPSYVAVGDDGAVTGFLACHARRMQLGERTIRAVCCSHLAVAQDDRGGADGALLLRRCLSGAQDLTITDTGIEIVARIWRVFGGHVDIARSLEWMHILRPATLGLHLAQRGLARQPVSRYDLPVPGLPLHLATRAIPRLQIAPDPQVRSTRLEPAEAVELLPRLLRGTKLRPAYDVPYLTWVLRQIGEMAGELVCRVVWLGTRPVGWFIYLNRPGGNARVLQVLAEPSAGEAVVAELFADGRRRGCVLLTGRLEPQLDEPLRRRLTAIGFGERHLVHSRDPDVLAALTGGSTLVTRLDGEWW